MKKFTLDQAAGLIIFCNLTLLWLPDFLLLPWSWCLALIVLVGLLLFLFNGRFGAVFLSVIIGFLALGYTHGTALNLMEKADYFHQLGQKKTLEFYIDEIITQQSYTALIVITKDPQHRIYVNWKSADIPQLGEWWKGELRIRPISSRLNFGGFDRQQWYFSKRVSGYAFIQSAVKIAEKNDWRNQRLSQSLEQTKILSQQGLLMALAFGERAWLPNEIWKIYQQSNTAHLIAISGLHIGLAMSLGFLIGRAVQFLLPTRWISPYFPLISGLLLALIYSHLAGFAIPTLRAIVAISIVLAVRLYRGYCTVWQFFLRTVAILLLFDPMMILSASFWLSVSAVCCLIVWYQLVPLANWLTVESKCYKARYFFALFHLQVGLLLLFMPIQWALFNGFSASGFVANLITVPLFSLVLVPLVLFAVFTQGAFNSWVYADHLVHWITEFLALFQHQWISVSHKTTLIFTALLAIVIFYIAYRKSARWFSGYTISALGLFLFSSISIIYDYIYKPNWQLAMLDVGQGLAMLIVKDQQALLYDTGAGWQGGSMAEIEVLPYIQRQGLILEQLILSHDDNDHAGGAKAVLQQYPRVSVLSSSNKNYAESHRTFCQKGVQWQWQGLDFRVLSPKSIVAEAGNPDSCVLLVSDGTYKILLTGDADVATENQFAQQIGKIHLLQVGHHGSKTSTGENLLKHSQPQIALISSGRWNPWGFPHASVTKRLNRYQSAVYNSAVSGQVNVNFYRNEIKIETARTALSPWYAGHFGQ